MSKETNENLWRLLYTDRIPAEQTAQECNFIEHFMPVSGFPRLLDLACGTGRHSLEMASRGYHVTGVDINVKALQVAAEVSTERDLNARFVAADLRELDHLDGEFDGILLIWQTFGFFDSNVQVGMFSQLRRLLRHKGRLVLDLHNAQYYRQETDFASDANEELSRVFGDFNSTSIPYSELSYADDLKVEFRRADLFDPHLFSPGDIAGIAANYNFQMIGACSNYSPRTAATRDHQRMQLVFEAIAMPPGQKSAPIL